MRVQSARAKQAGRVKFLFQCVLNALMYRIQRREDGHRHWQGRTGLLRSSEQGGLTPHRCGGFAKGFSF